MSERRPIAANHAPDEDHIFRNGASVEEIADAIRASGGRCSDGPIEGFEAPGWAMMIFHGERGHYWTYSEALGIGRHGIVTGWLALCGHTATTNPKCRPVGEGNYGRCKNCERKLSKR